MVEPLSIASTAAGLAVTITRVIVDVDKFRVAVRDAHDEMISINSELTSLRYILDTAATDIKAPGIKVPAGFEVILGQCETCLNQLDASLKTYDTMRLKDRFRFVWSGKDKILGYRDVLAAHKSHLSLAIGWMTSNLAHDIKSDTTQIKVHTTDIMADTAELKAGQNDIRLILEKIQGLHESALQSANLLTQKDAECIPDDIFAKIDTLTAELPDSLKAQVQESNDRLQRYFDSLTTEFAPTVIDESDFWRETEGTIREADENKATLVDRPSHLQANDQKKTSSGPSDSSSTVTPTVPPKPEEPITVEVSSGGIDHELTGMETLARKAWREKMVEEMKSEAGTGPKSGKTYVRNIDYRFCDFHHYRVTPSGLSFEAILRPGATRATFYAWIRTWILTGNTVDVTFIWSIDKGYSYISCSPLELTLELRDELLLDRVLKHKIFSAKWLHLALLWNVCTARKLVRAGHSASKDLEWLVKWEIAATDQPTAYGLSLQQVRNHVRYVLTFLLGIDSALKPERNLLAIAALAGAATTATFLLEKGANPNGDDDLKSNEPHKSFYNPPLFRAIAGRHSHIIKILSAAGVDCLERHRVRLPTLDQKRYILAMATAVEFAAHLDSCARENKGFPLATILPTHTDHLEMLNQACGTNHKAKSSKELGLKIRSFSDPWFKGTYTSGG